MSYYLFDNISIGILLAIGLEIVAVIVYNFSEWKWRKLALLSGFLLLGLLILMDIFVETNREQLERITREVVRAAQDEQPRTIAFHLSPELLVGGKYNKKVIVQIIDNWLSEPIIDSNLISKLEVINDRNDNGRVEISILTQFDPQGKLASVSLLKSRWRLEFIKQGKEPYKIVNIINTSVNDGAGIDWANFKL